MRKLTLCRSKRIIYHGSIEWDPTDNTEIEWVLTDNTEIEWDITDNAIDSRWDRTDNSIDSIDDRQVWTKLSDDADLERDDHERIASAQRKFASSAELTSPAQELKHCRGLCSSEKATAAGWFRAMSELYGHL